MQLCALPWQSAAQVEIQRKSGYMILMEPFENTENLKAFEPLSKELEPYVSDITDVSAKLRAYEAMRRRIDEMAGGK
jgi:hypothetical protein